jgi:hypothetical protein
MKLSEKKIRTMLIWKTRLELLHKKVCHFLFEFLWTFTIVFSFQINQFFLAFIYFIQLMRMFARHKRILVWGRKHAAGLESFDDLLEVQAQNIESAYLFDLLLEEAEKAFYNKSRDVIISGS